jgi:hydrogenase maturation factor
VLKSAITVVAAILAIVVGPPASATVQSGPNILLSNDDGYEAAGILAVHDALIEEGGQEGWEPLLHRLIIER